MHANNNNSNTTNANSGVVVRPTAHANAYGQPSSNNNANDGGNTFPVVGVAGGQNAAMAPPNNYFGNPFLMSQMWNNAAAMMNLNAAAVAAAATGNFPVGAMMGAMPQFQQQQPQAAPSAGAAKKTSTAKGLRDMTKHAAKSRSDVSEATSHKESPLSDEEVEHPQKERRRHKNEEKVEEQDSKQQQQPQLAKPIIDDSLPEPCASKTCAFCRTQKTPLWRNGPFGPKTLCNACGVRFKLGMLAGDEDGHVLCVIVPRQKRRKNGSAGTASHAAATAAAAASAAAQNTAPASATVVDASNTETAMTTNTDNLTATGRFAAVTAANAARAGFANAPLKVRHTVHTKKSVEPKVRGIVGGWRPEMGGPMRVSSPFVVTDYDGAVLLMVLAGENDKNTTATTSPTTAVNNNK
jgi:hypothetical protein